MEKTKAKKAVKKSESRKQQAAEAMALMGAQAAAAGRINPELPSSQIDLQPADGYVNPYHAMGAMAPTMYSAGNMLPGYNFPVMVNPEA